MDFFHKQSRCPLNQYFITMPRAGKSAHWPHNDIPPYCRLPHQGKIPVVTSFLSVLPYSVWSFSCCFAETIQPTLSCSSGGIALYVGIYLVCLWDEVSSVSSFAATLDPGNCDLLSMKIQGGKIFLQSFNLFLRAPGRPKSCCPISGRFIMGVLLISTSTGRCFTWFRYGCILCNSFL